MSKVRTLRPFPDCPVGLCGLASRTTIRFLSWVSRSVTSNHIGFKPLDASTWCRPRHVRPQLGSYGIGFSAQYSAKSHSINDQPRRRFTWNIWVRFFTPRDLAMKVGTKYSPITTA